MTGGAFPPLFRHCEERSDEAIQGVRISGLLRCFAPTNDDYSCHFRLFIWKIFSLAMAEMWLSFPFVYLKNIPPTETGNNRGHTERLDLSVPPFFI
jgi:hypothetical protein